MGLHKTVSSTSAIGISGLIPPHIHLLQHLLRLPHRLGPQVPIGARSPNPTHYSNRDAYYLTKDRLHKELQSPDDRRPPPPPEGTRPSSQACKLPELKQYIQLRIQKEWEAADTYRISKFQYNPTQDQDWFRQLTRHQVSIASRIITGHIGTQAYLSRFSLSDSNICRSAKETRSHLLFTCPEAPLPPTEALTQIPNDRPRSYEDLQISNDTISYLVAWWNTIYNNFQRGPKHPRRFLHPFFLRIKVKEIERTSITSPNSQVSFHG